MTDIIVDVVFDETPKTPTFADLNLAKPLLKALGKSGYATPTPIQLQSIPPSLNGQDLLLSAQTGSGKTAAFVLPILHRLATAPKPEPIYHTPLTDDDNKGTRRRKKAYQKPAVQAVILTPTRELALQVQNSVRTYGEFLNGVFSVPLVGGSDYRGQIRALTKGVQIIVATPGRFIDHLNSGRIDLSSVKTLVLDEADRMLDMGFAEDIETILGAMPKTRQTIMSSATWDGQVGKIAESFTNNPAKVSIKVESAHIDESVYFCDDFRHKNDILYSILNDDEIAQAVIFVATKMSSERLAQDLIEKGHTAHYLHGDLPQGKRNRVVKDIKDKKCRFLIATDVAARGIDIAGISHVINYDLPRQAEDYVHRIGRSGRAGRTGVAMSLCSRDDRHLLSAIDRYLKRQMRVEMIDGLEPKLRFDEKPKKGRNRKGDKEYNKSFGGRFKKDYDKKDFGGRERTFGKSDDFKSKKPFEKQGFERDFDKKFDKKSFKKDGFEVPTFDKSKSDTKRQNSKTFAEFDKKRNFGKTNSKNFDKAEKGVKKSPKGFKGARGAEEIVFHQTSRRFGDK